jgi:hypothetical protein
LSLYERAFGHAKNISTPKILLTTLGEKKFKNLTKDLNRVVWVIGKFFGEKLLIFVTMRNHKKQGAIW